MEWSPTAATNAYLDTLQLCNNYRRQYHHWTMQEPGSDEFVSALAAGVKAKLIVEVTNGASTSTIALAAAARLTGGRLVCMLPEPVLAESKEVIHNAGLTEQVEFRTGDPCLLLPNCENVDFSLVDCKDENNTKFLNLLNVNPTRSVVVARNLAGGRKGLRGWIRQMDENVAVRSLKHPTGKDIQVIVISKNGDEIDKRFRIRGSQSRKRSRWVAKFDEESGEEHIFRVPHSLSDF